MPAHSYATQIGWGEETTYGTAATITDFSAFVSESIVREHEFALSDAIRGDRRAHRPEMRRRRRANTTGSLNMEAGLEDQLLWLKAALGAVSTQQIGTTDAYTHTFTPADTLPSLTVEVDRDSRVFTYPGIKVAQYTFTVDWGQGFVEREFQVIGSGAMTDGGSATSASYAATQRWWIPEEAEFKIGGSAANARRFTMTVANTFVEDGGSYGFNSTRQRLDATGIREVTGEVVLTFDDMTEVSKIAAETDAKFELILTGAEIEDNNDEEEHITLEVVRYDGEEPQIPGRDQEIPLTLNYRALYDGTNPEVQIEVTNRADSV